MDPDSKMIPGLATSWKPIDDRTWEFKLRKDAKFHAGSPLRSLLATYNTQKGLGAVNWGRYSNARVDYLIEQALQQVDGENRRIILQRATGLSMADLGLMPIHFQFTIWATKKGVSHVPRTDEYTLAFLFRPAKP